MQVQCNPSDATLIVVTGPYTFRIMNVSETVWRQWGWCKAENVSVICDRIFIYVAFYRLVIMNYFDNIPSYNINVPT